jgi:glycosyltransferase involved in cell wall biosynthesis
MHTLHLVHQYLPEHVGGVELYAHWLTQALHRRGQQVTIFYRRSAAGVGQEHRTEGGVKVWAAWRGVISPTRRFLATFRDPAMVQLFGRILEESNPDLVHVQHLMGLPVALIDSLSQRGIPFVITLHDFWWVCANAQLLTNYSQRVCDGPQAYLNCARCAMARAGHPRLWPALPPLAGLLGWRNLVLRRMIKAADRLIAPTGFVGRWYAAHGVAADKLQVMQLGLESAPTVSLRQQRTDGVLRFAYIGGLSWQKGLHVLLEAFRSLRGVAELWIAGDESFDPTYVGHLRELATPQVRFLGRLTRQAVWETLARVDVVVVPSLWYETFSFIVSEAFVSGAPVVASQLGPLADRVRHEVDGLLVPAGDVAAWRSALQRLVDEPGLLERLQANVRPPLTLDEHVQQLQVLYRSLVDAKRLA